MPDRRRQIFRAAFNFLTEHSPAGNDEAYWCRTADDLGRVCAELGNDPLALDLMAAVYSELGRGD